MARKNMSELANSTGKRGRKAMHESPIMQSIGAAFVEAENLQADPLPADPSVVVDFSELSDSDWKHLKAEAKTCNIAESLAKAVSGIVGYEVKAKPARDAKNGIRTLTHKTEKAENTYVGIYRPKNREN
jgi:hypothetical protein